MIVARTDALSATFLDSNIDPIDHPYILGQVDPDRPEVLLTFPEAGLKAINDTFADEAKRQDVMNSWNLNASNMSLQQATKLAEGLGFKLVFDWEAPRSEEGYYRVKGSIDWCVKRGIKMGETADMIWMETPTPDLSVAKEFADGIFAENPHLMLAYNLSPSFNWDAANLSDTQISQFIPDLAKMGYCWQFITLAGFHLNALMTEILSREFGKKNMLAYLDLVQRREKAENVD